MPVYNKRGILLLPKVIVLNPKDGDSTLHRLKHNQDISMRTINDLCRILGCQIEDIAVYVPSDKDQKL